MPFLLDLWQVGLEDIGAGIRSEEHTSELQSQSNLVCRLLLEKKKNICAPYEPHGNRRSTMSFGPRRSDCVEAPRTLAGSALYRLLSTVICRTSWSPV